jgi:hypothetical protein
MPLPCPEDLNNPTPGTDAISLLDIQNVFDGGVIPIGINEYYRNGLYVFTNIDGTTDKIPIGPAGNQISFADFFCGNGEIVYPITQNTENVDVQILFGSKYWTSLRPKRLIVMPGVTVYNTKTGGYAMRIYDNFKGKLTIENRGSIEGAGGIPYPLKIFNRYYNGSTHRYGPYAPTNNHALEALNYFVSYKDPIFNPYTPYKLYQVTHPINAATILTISSDEKILLTNEVTTLRYPATLGTNSNGQTIIVPHPPVQTIVTSKVQYTIDDVPTSNYVPGYIPGYIDKLTLNGNEIPPEEYTATDGINIILNTPVQPDINGNISGFLRKKPWIAAEVGYVYSNQAGPGFTPIYRSYKGSSSALPTDYLFSTSKTEGPNAGYTYQGIAFYAPPPSGGYGGNAVYIGPAGSASANPKPTVYINNLGTIYAGGGAGGQGGTSTVGLTDPPVKYLYGDGGGQLEITLQGKGASGGLGGKGQGYNQPNTSGKDGDGLGVKADIRMDRVGPNSFKFPPYSDITVFAMYSGQTNHYYSSNTTLKYEMYFSGTNGQMSFVGNNNSISLYGSGSGFQGTLTIDPSQTYTYTGFDTPIKTINYVTGGGADQPSGQISVKSALTSSSADIDLVIPVPPGAPGGKGGDGATWANTGATGNDNGLPGGNGGYSIVNASQYVSYINQGTIAGQTT